jgi:hypothetical protein
MVDQPFSIVDKQNLQPLSIPDFTTGSKAEADQILKQIFAQEPHNRGKFQVIGTDELEEVL